MPTWVEGIWLACTTVLLVFLCLLAVKPWNTKSDFCSCMILGITHYYKTKLLSSFHRIRVLPLRLVCLGFCVSWSSQNNIYVNVYIMRIVPSYQIMNYNEICSRIFPTYVSFTFPYNMQFSFFTMFSNIRCAFSNLFKNKRLISPSEPSKKKFKIFFETYLSWQVSNLQVNFLNLVRFSWPFPYYSATLK